MATQIIISALPPLPNLTGSGTPKGTDLIPATDITDTTSAATGTTKKYTRSAELNFALQATGLTAYTACLTATTVSLTTIYANGTAGDGATLTNAGAQSILVLDGVTLAAGDRVLVKDQASTLQNGLYTVTNVGSALSNWIMTRATDYNAPAEVIQYGVVFVNQGAVNGGLLWQETGAGPFVIGTTPITFAQFLAQSLSFPITLAQGGTNAALTANNGGIFYSNATTGAILTGTATARQMLQSGASAAPAWSTTTWPALATANNLLYASATNVISELASAASAVLVTSAGGVPSLSQTLPSVVQSNITALGTIATGVWQGSLVGGTYGGTGVNNGSSTFTIGGNTLFSGAFTFAGTLTGNTAVTFPTSGTLATTAQSFAWNGIVGTTQNPAVVNNGYVNTNAGTTTITLPATMAFGSVIKIQGLGAGGWIIQANTGQTVHVGSVASSVAGTVSSANQYDAIQLICIIANTTWSTESAYSSGLIVV